MKSISNEEIINSSEYKEANEKAQEYISNKEKLMALLQEGMKKLGEKSFSEIVVAVTSVFRLLKAYANGDYREVPLKTIGAMVATVVYFISPFDVIPDFLPVIGYGDDASLFAFVIKKFSDDIANFTLWEKGTVEDEI